MDTVKKSGFLKGLNADEREAFWAGSALGAYVGMLSTMLLLLFIEWFSRS